MSASASGHTRKPTAIVAVAAVLTALAAHAHHGNLVAFDLAKQWTRPAVVAKFDYVNPHPRIAFDVEHDGATERWAADLLSTPGSLARNGWSKTRSLEALRPGAAVDITIAPSKTGDRTGLVLKIAAADGSEIATEGIPLTVGPGR